MGICLGNVPWRMNCSVIQSVNDSRQDVFDSANDAWDAYIRK